MRQQQHQQRRSAPTRRHAIKATSTAMEKSSVNVKLKGARTSPGKDLSAASAPMPGAPRGTSKLAQGLMTTTGRWRTSSTISTSGMETSRSSSCTTTGAAGDGGDGGPTNNTDWETRVWVWGCSANGQCVEEENLLCLSKPRWLRSMEGGGLVVVKTVTCGRTVSVAVTDVGQVWSWGSGPALGRDGSTRGPGMVEGLTRDVTCVAVGEEHALACTGQGDLFAWGKGTGGKLGLGDVSHHLLPVQVTAAPLHHVSIVKVACGQRHSAALAADGSLFTFGGGRAGQLGHGNLKDQPRPKKVGFFEGGDAVVGVSCGANHTAAFNARGELYCWGWGEHGRLGLGHEEMTSVPALVGGGLESKKVSGVACGSAHTVVMTAEGIVYAFGWNEYGQVRRKHAVVPTPSSSSSASSSSSHDQHILHPVRVLESSSSPTPHTTASNNNDDSHHDGDADEDHATTHAPPSRPPSSSASAATGKNHIIKIGAGFAHSAALTASGRLFLWGFGEEGQLGTGEEVSLGLPVEMELLPQDVHVVDVALGHCHTVVTVSRSSRCDLEARFTKALHREGAAKVLARFFRVVLMRGRMKMLAQVAASGETRGSGVRKGGIVGMEEGEDLAVVDGVEPPAAPTSSSPPPSPQKPLLAEKDVLPEEEEQEEHGGGEDQAKEIEDDTPPPAEPRPQGGEEDKEEEEEEEEESKSAADEEDQEGGNVEEERGTVPSQLDKGGQDSTTESACVDDKSERAEVAHAAGGHQSPKATDDDDAGSGVGEVPAKEQTAAVSYEGGEAAVAVPTAPMALDKDHGGKTKAVVDEAQQQQHEEGTETDYEDDFADDEEEGEASEQQEPQRQKEMEKEDIKVEKTQPCEEENEEEKNSSAIAAKEEEEEREEEEEEVEGSDGRQQADKDQEKKVSAPSVVVVGGSAEEDDDDEEEEGAPASSPAGDTVTVQATPSLPDATSSAAVSANDSVKTDESRPPVMTTAVEAQPEEKLSSFVAGKSTTLPSGGSPSPVPSSKDGAASPPVTAPASTAASTSPVIPPTSTPKQPPDDGARGATADDLPPPSKEDGEGGMHGQENPATPSRPSSPPAPLPADTSAAPKQQQLPPPPPAAAAFVPPLPHKLSNDRPWRYPPKSFKPAPHVSASPSVAILPKELPLWGANKPSTAAKTRGLRVRLEKGDKLQRKWREKASARAAAAATLAKSSSEPDLPTEEDKFPKAFPFQRRSKSLVRIKPPAAANGRAPAVAAAAASAASVSAAPIAVIGGGGAKKVMKAADLRDDYNYFKERYCTEVKDQPSKSPTSVDFGEFVRKRTNRQKVSSSSSSPDGTMSLLGDEEQTVTKAVMLGSVQRKSVTKVHRRLGLVHHDSSVLRLPRSAAAQQEPSGLDGPRRDVRRPNYLLQSSNKAVSNQETDDDKHYGSPFFDDEDASPHAPEVEEML